MELDVFVRRFEQEFEEVALGALNAETAFRQLEEWSSMQALILIAMIDIEFGVTISAEEFKKSTTIADIYNMITKKVA